MDNTLGYSGSQGSSTGQTSFKNIPEEELNLKEIIEDMFLVLTGKEKTVITERFSLNNKPKQTLERIGKKFSVTRERVRQIEKIALSKLRRTVHNTKLETINQLCVEILHKNGGLKVEQTLIEQVLEVMESKHDVDAHIIRLSLSINPDIESQRKTSTFKPYVRLKELPSALVKEVISKSIALLKKQKEVMSFEELAHVIQGHFKEKDINIQPESVVSALETDKRLKKTEEGFGLMTWRHINPKSIRDKAYIVLKKNNKPLHFIEIANLIETSDFDNKVVTKQAVHNELIRNENFILVGRGLYALKEWGYSDGTVADVIEAILDKKSPLSKQDIIKEVLKQRKVKKGTISLNLQKNPHFVRVGRAVYALDKSKKK